MRVRWRLAAVAAAAVFLASCYQDEFKASPGFDGFLDRIGRVCYPDTIGPTLVKEWAQGNGPDGSGAGFIDATSSLYYGKWTAAQYRGFIIAMTDTSAATSKAIDCIVRQLPESRPAAGGGGSPAGRGGVPPPPQ